MSAPPNDILAVFYLFVVFIGGMVLAMLVLLAFILIGAFAGWIAMQITDRAKKLNS